MKWSVKEMIKHEKNPTLKTAYERALTNLETVPINFYPKDNLSRTVFQIGKQFITSEVLGQHKQGMKVIKEGGLLKVIPEGRLIELPADHFFNGNKPTWDGMKTLIHELCHDPSRNVFEFSKEVHLTPTQTEELIADLMSAKIAIKMGFSREKVLSLYYGREAVYGKFPFRELLEKATKEKKFREAIPGRKVRELPKRLKEMRKKSLIHRK